jgi:diguanylate cyclase (GGDEF)-like protein
VVEKGRILFQEGEEGNELFIIKSGCMGISIRLPDGKEQVLRDFGPGDFFGEMSIFEDEPRSATCYALETAVLYSMEKSDFFRILESDPSIAIKIMYRMSSITTERLRNTSEFLTDMVLWGEEARKRAITDSLTGAFNRQYLEDSLERMFRNALKENRPLALIMVDLDHFRRINDGYGHGAGDRILLAAVEVFHRHLRKEDVLARYGGDEFTMVLADTDLEEASRIAEGIRRDVEKISTLKRRRGRPDGITTSQGIAVYPDHARELRVLREMADKALYKSKEEGRNRVSAASP